MGIHRLKKYLLNYGEVLFDDIGLEVVKLSIFKTTNKKLNLRLWTNGHEKKQSLRLIYTVKFHSKAVVKHIQ